jgi:hypothetical protein
MFNAISRNGTRITGTVETLAATAAIDEGSWAYVGNGHTGFAWIGDTDVDWDSQVTTTDKEHRMLFIDENGGEYWEHQIAIVDEEDLELVALALEPIEEVDKALAMQRLIDGDLAGIAHELRQRRSIDNDDKGWDGWFLGKYASLEFVVWPQRRLR